MKTKTAITLIAAAFSSMLLASCSSTTTGSTASAGGVKPYTKTTCAVTDNKLGSMGPVITKVHDGQEVKFCCKPCIKKFESNPSKYTAGL